MVTIDNPYESPEVQFPDGSLATMVTPTDPDAFIKKSLAVRTADTGFVLDQLGLLNAGHNPDVDGRRLPKGLAGALDPTKPMCPPSSTTGCAGGAAGCWTGRQISTRQWSSSTDRGGWGRRRQASARDTSAALWPILSRAPSAKTFQFTAKP
ncbi:hypothetical protein GCM10023084_61450 [Streptomyces lacrimifluminis]|uniref:Uncharacterized protein n=1 Tax=Streptomyces lacrimifluminis TaxID=1500077 RepID=A0A917L810_9ACTN|nr:hypothetical protein GCM10012282_46290 [Streptomyces lacrimifluminis]